MRSHNRYKEKICAEEGEDVSIVKRKEREGIWVHFKITEERIYQTLEVTSNGTSVFCRQEEW